jgi:hypothetical protein
MSSQLGPQPRPPRGELPDPGRLGSLGVYDGLARAAVILLPVALVAVWALARHRRLAGADAARAWQQSLAEVGIVYLTLPAVWITMLPGPRAGHVSPRASLVPLQDLATMSTFQIVGNLLLLAAPGFLVPVRFADLASLPRALAVAATCSVTIEATQYLLPLDRVASVDDVLLNTIGAGVASLASRRWWRLPASAPDLHTYTTPKPARVARPTRVDLRADDPYPAARMSRRRWRRATAGCRSSFRRCSG